jgi:T-complex protein 1 subunit beta
LLHDALAVLSQTVKEPKTTLGGGCAEMVMAKAVDSLAQKVGGKKRIAVDSLITALRQLLTILADNVGLDSSALVSELRHEVYRGMTTSGLDLLVPGGGIADMRELGVVESYKLKRAVVSSASEAAELLLRVDNIIRSAPRWRDRPLNGILEAAKIRREPKRALSEQNERGWG